jgi:streptogramin lyase
MRSIELRERVLFRVLWTVVIVAFLVGTAFWVGDVSSLMMGTAQSARPVPRPSAGTFASSTGSKTFTAEAPDAFAVWHYQCAQALAGGSTFVVFDVRTGETQQISDPTGC